jgi:hypothetical protein
MISNQNKTLLKPKTNSNLLHALPPPCVYYPFWSLWMVKIVYEFFTPDPAKGIINYDDAENYHHHSIMFTEPILKFETMNLIFCSRISSRTGGIWWWWDKKCRNMINSIFQRLTKGLTISIPLTLPSSCKINVIKRIKAQPARYTHHHHHQHESLVSKHA